MTPFNSSDTKGQALVEMIVASSLVLIPLMLSLPLLAKYFDAQHKVAQAAQHAVWERTVWASSASPYASQTAVRSDMELLTLTDARVFSHELTPIVSLPEQDDTSLDTPSTTGRSFMQYQAAPSGSHAAAVEGSANGYLSLIEPSADGRRLLDTASRSSGALTGIGAKTTKLLTDILEKTGFELDTNGYVRYHTGVQLRNPDWNQGIDVTGLPQGGLRYSGSLAMLTDGWQAAGPYEQALQLEHLNPGARLADSNITSGILKVASALPWTSKFEKLDLGHSDIDALPTASLRPWATKQ